MKIRLLHAMVATGILMFPELAFARIIENWEYERLVQESDLIVIAVAGPTELVADEPPKHMWPLEFVGQNTTFKLKHTFKGKAVDQQIKVLHFRFGDKVKKGEKAIIEPIQIVDGPLFVDFQKEPPAEYLLFLKRLKDGRYEPVSGRIDPGLSVRKLSSGHGKSGRNYEAR